MTSSGRNFQNRLNEPAAVAAPGVDQIKNLGDIIVCVRYPYLDKKFVAVQETVLIFLVL
jgi:hypothetical protein